jgi:hypothetical protein
MLTSKLEIFMALMFFILQLKVINLLLCITSPSVKAWILMTQIIEEVLLFTGLVLHALNSPCHIFYLCHLTLSMKTTKEILLFIWRSKV